MLKAIALGLVQGLTEFIPVSSSGHLILVGHVLNFPESSLAFDVALHIGTLVALLAVFSREFIKLARSIFDKTTKTKLAWLVVIATIPGALIGALLEGKVETVFRSTRLVAIDLIAMAVVMLIADRIASHRRKLETMGKGDALALGLAQGLAVIPGISRSGITITAGVLQGFDYVSATRFSFLMSAPIIAGAIVKVLLGGGVAAEISGHFGLFAAGIAASLLSGLWAIKFMLRYLENHGLKAFAYYRIALGLLVIISSLR